MADAGLRDLERRWRATGAVDDEALYLKARVRAGEIGPQALNLAALLGHSAARMTNPDYARTADLGLFESVRSQVINVFGKPSFDFGNVPEAARAFIENIHEQALEARVTLAHYGLVEAGDKAPPRPTEALEALAGDLKANPGHMEAIAQMNKPVLQLIPVYEPEGAGFQRMVNAYNSHIPQRLRERLEEQGLDPAFVWPDLQNRWEMNSGTPGKIVRWQVAVVEGEKVLPEVSNRFLMGRDGRVQRLEDQLNQWQEYCQERGLHLCGKVSYDFLQMQEIRQSAQNTPLEQLGIDHENVTYLGDKTRQSGSFVPRGYWGEGQVRFNDNLPGDQDGLARFRASVVVDIP